MANPVRMQRAHALLLAAALALIAGGAGLAAMGAGYVASWVRFVEQLRAAPPTPVCGLCPERMVQFLLAPDPRPVFLAYVLAMPMGLATGYLLHRQGRRVRGSNSSHGTILRITGGVLVASMTGMALLYVAAALTGATLGPQDPGNLRTAYFVCLLMVPALIVGAGGTLLAESVSVHLTARMPTARG